MAQSRASRPRYVLLDTLRTQEPLPVRRANMVGLALANGSNSHLECLPRSVPAEKENKIGTYLLSAVLVGR